MKVMTNSKNIDQELMRRLSGGWCTKLIKVTVFKGKIAEVEGAYGEKGEPSDFRHYSACCIILDFSGFARNLRTTFSMKVVFLPKCSMCSLRFPFGFPLDSLLFKKNSIRCWNRHPELYRDSSTVTKRGRSWKYPPLDTVKHWEWPRMGGYHPPKKIIQKIREIAKHTKHMKSIEKPCVSSSLWLRTVTQVNRWVRSHSSYESRGGDWNACGSEKLEEIP